MIVLDDSELFSCWDSKASCVFTFSCASPDIGKVADLLVSKMFSSSGCDLFALVLKVLPVSLVDVVDGPAMGKSSSGLNILTFGLNGVTLLFFPIFLRIFSSSLKI